MTQKKKTPKRPQYSLGFTSEDVEITIKWKTPSMPKIVSILIGILSTQFSSKSATDK